MCWLHAMLTSPWIPFLCCLATFLGASAVPISTSSSVSEQEFDLSGVEGWITNDFTSNFSDVVELQARVWKPPSKFPGGVFPEFAIKEIVQRPSTGICFSGGGYRSYIATLGSLRGLHDLGLLDSTRYIFGISGGSWAVLLFSYYARGRKGVAGSDEELLGNITDPEHQSMESLRRIPPTCARKSATLWMVAQILKLLVNELRGPRQLSRVWRAAVGRVFLEQYGVSTEGLLAYDEANVQDIRARNPALDNETFHALLPDRPFPVVGMTMLGPLDLEPFPTKNRTYRLLEISPLYVGSPTLGNVTFNSHRRAPARAVEVEVGGYIEPFAFGSDSLPHAALSQDAASGTIAVRSRRPLFSFADAAGTGSYAPAGFFGSNDFLSWLGKIIGIGFNYFAPAASRLVNTGMAFGDGGDMESPNIIGLLQRGVSSIVVFGNFANPLRPREEWDPFHRAPTVLDIDDDIPAFFGIVLQDMGERTSYEFRYNQVFHTHDFPRVVAAMQAAQATGRGIVTTTELETVDNEWWGVGAGFRVNVTWVYMSRSAKWESRLPAELKPLVLPEKFPSNPTSTRRKGPFKGFPYYGTGKLYYDEANTNLLADLCGWVVKENAEKFRAALGGGRDGSAQKESSSS